MNAEQGTAGPGPAVSPDAGKPSSPHTVLPSPKKVQTYVFGAILLLLFLVVCRLFAPFFTVLLWSALLYILMSPLHDRVIRRIRPSPHDRFLKSLIAGLFALGTAIIILIPILFVVSEFVKQIMELIHLITDTFRSRPQFLEDILERFSTLIAEISADQIIIRPSEIQRRILSFFNMGLQNLVKFSSSIALNIGSFIVSLVFMIFCLFFFYLDGAFLAGLVQNLIPIRRDYINTLTGKFIDIAKNLILGYVIVALVQTTLAYIVFTIFQVKGALVFAGLTFICVFIPMFGGALVWLPLGVIRIISGNLAGGIVFLAVSGVCISLLDNVLRPMFLQDRINLHPLIIFFAIMGGIQTFGFNGIILGPMVVILFLTVLDLFLTEHQIEHGTKTD
jgi:predicted PurR-regulated permease PerM